jgi:long-chain acyl-CoA synthetase
VHDKVMAAAAKNTGVKKLLGGMAVASKMKGLGQGRLRSLWDFIVFSKVAALLGGRVRCIGTGSAPISPKVRTHKSTVSSQTRTLTLCRFGCLCRQVLGFYRMFFSCRVSEGYGMSEVCPTHFTLQADFVGSGTVGPPTSNNETKLVDVLDMGYSV